jgi:murein DD-endopeptidase MepM/ murein hydrolase activator NlpD
LIYPGQDFTSCLLDEETPKDERARTLDELTRQLDESDYWNEFAPMVKGPLAAPMQSPNYRGWYYCYINTNTCGTNAVNSIKWDPELSRFNGRLNQHKGIDIFAGNHDASGATQLQAVAAGKVFFRSVTGWGNTVFLPFTIGGDRYYAVYAHLPDSAKAMDGRIVGSAESLGSTGCSGNAGNAQGKCNDYCEVDGSWRSDQHLHFEILDIAKGNKPVDPETMLPSKPILDPMAPGMKLCSRCKNGNCKP